MYSFVVRMNPLPGKEAELLDVLKERNKISNENGFPHMVAQQMLFPDAQATVVVAQFQDLAAFEAWLERNRTDAAFQEAGRRIAATLPAPAPRQVYESLAESERSGDVNYFLTATSFAAPGKAAELRQALEKAFGRLPSSGCSLRVLQREIAPEDGSNFTTSFGFASLTGLEEFMHDPGLGAVNSETAQLLDRPNRQRLYRVLMPAVRP